MRIRATLEATGVTTTAFVLPDAAVEELGGGGRPKVAVTVKGRTFRTSIARMGGRYLLGMSADRRAEAGLAAGDVVDLELSLDEAPRHADVPDDLAAAIASEPRAQEHWDTLSFSKRQWHVLQVTAAKKPETRAARVAKSKEMLREGRAR